MNRYILLRTQIEPAKDSHIPDEIVVKFFPVRNPLGELTVLLADSPESAFAQIRARLPHLAHFFAIEPEAHYHATVARLAALSATRRAGGKPAPTQRHAAYGKP